MHILVLGDKGRSVARSGLHSPQCPRVQIWIEYALARSYCHWQAAGWEG